MKEFMEHLKYIELEDSKGKHPLIVFDPVNIHREITSRYNINPQRVVSAGSCQFGTKETGMFFFGMSVSLGDIKSNSKLNGKNCDWFVGFDYHHRPIITNDESLAKKLKIEILQTVPNISIVDECQNIRHVPAMYCENAPTVLDFRAMGYFAGIWSFGDPEVKELTSPTT